MMAIVDPLTISDWDDRVARLPGTSFFHTSAWARVLAETYGYRPCYVVSGNADAFDAVLPMMEVRSWLTGRRGVSLPFTDECEPACASSIQFADLWRQAKAHGAEQRWKYCEIRGGRSFLSHDQVAVKFHGHRLSLTSDTEALFQKSHSAVRQGVRKAERSGVSVEFSHSDEAMRTFYSLFCLTRKRHGAPPQPYRFFENVKKYILDAGKGTLVLARTSDAYVAGAIYFHFGGSVLYKFGASDESQQQFRGNNLVMWRAIERHAQEGFTLLDFGRTSEANAGLRRFKLSWGAEEYAIEYFRYDLRQNRHVGSEDRASGWQAPVLHALPDPLFRFIGTAAYRHLA